MPLDVVGVQLCTSFTIVPGGLLFLKPKFNNVWGLNVGESCDDMGAGSSKVWNGNWRIWVEILSVDSQREKRASLSMRFIRA